jgi:tRNA (cytidine32/uridine32-2'-O)-methyltransferase
MKNIFNNIRIILIKTTEAGNIGAVARAMKNMCLSDLYLVNPQNFPSSVATARASSADDILENATVVDNLSDALDGINLVIGASARQRERAIPQLDVIKSCEKAKNIAENDGKVAIMFGTERSGLTNNELDFANILMTIPGNPDYFSLNLAQAVQVFAYQNFITINNKVQKKEQPINKNIASFNEINSFYSHLFQVLEHIDYIDKNRPLDLTQRRLKRIFSKAELAKDEVAMLRGILRNIKPYQD